MSARFPSNNLDIKLPEKEKFRLSPAQEKLVAAVVIAAIVGVVFWWDSQPSNPGVSAEVVAEEASLAELLAERGAGEIVEETEEVAEEEWPIPPPSTIDISARNQLNQSAIRDLPAAMAGRQDNLRQPKPRTLPTASKGGGGGNKGGGSGGGGRGGGGSGGGAAPAAVAPPASAPGQTPEQPQPPTATEKGTLPPGVGENETFDATGMYWLDVSGDRHNPGCRLFRNIEGQFLSRDAPEDERGEACTICGG